MTLLAIFVFSNVKTFTNVSEKIIDELFLNELDNISYIFDYKFAIYVFTVCL